MQQRRIRRGAVQRQSMFRLEPLEPRLLLSGGIEPVTLADSSLFGLSGDGGSVLIGQAASISADGQLVVFESSATNLVPNDFNATTDIFLYDRGTGRVSLLSANAAGTGSGDGNSTNAQITPDGHSVLFVSSATNLVDPPVNSGIVAFRRDNVYLRDLQTGHTTMISINAAGNSDGDSNSNNPSISADGRRIVFESPADDLVPGDTNDAIDVFLRELNADGTGTTTRISVSSTGAQGNRPSWNPSISANGQFIVFQSDADNLVNNDNNTAPDIFIRNLNTNTTKLVTADPTGQQSANSGGSHLSRQPVSADGRYVVFQSDAGNLVGQNTDFQTNAFVRDTQTDTTRLLSINRAGNAGSDGHDVVITPNGQFAGFISNSNDVASDVNDTNGLWDVYLSTITPTTISNRLVSVNTAGTSGGDGNSGTGQHPVDFSGGFLQISDDGRFVAFAGEAGNLAPGISDANQGQSTNSNFRRDVFARDMQSGTTRAVSVTLGGASTGNSGSYTPSMSSDGRFVAFESDASDLLPNDTNAQQDIFVRDVTAGTTELASRHSPFLPTEILTGGEVMDTTPDGRFVAFTSERGDLLTPAVPGIGGGFTSYLFVRDRQTGEVQLASVRPDGSTYGTFGGGSFQAAALSADGRFVAFATPFNDLDAMSSGGVGGVYVRDLLTGVTRLISRNTTTGAPANQFSGGTAVAISRDGRYVAFTSVATNLVSDLSVPADQANLYVHDRQTGTTRLVSVNADGTAPGNGNGDTAIEQYLPTFNADSTKLVFVSLSSDLVAGVSDTNNNFDVFVYDLAAHTSTLASVSTTPNAAGDAGSGFGILGLQPALSATGQFVVFGSNSGNLVAQSNNDRSQIYVRDLMNNITRLASVNDANDAADQNSLDAAISADGSRVLFESSATNLTGLSANEHNQLYVRDLNASSTQLVSVNAAGTAWANDDSDFLVGSTSISPSFFTADGRYVAFRSLASDLVNGFVDGNGSSGDDLYLRDLKTGTTVLVTYNNSGTASANRGSNGRNLLAADSPTVVFDAPANDLVSGDRNDGFFSFTNDVFAYTFAGAGMISGTVFNDADGSGTLGAGESGIPFWTVYLDSNGNRRFDPGETNLQTDANGHYAFTGLLAGNYSVAADIDDGFVPTVPDFPHTYSVTLATDTASVTGRNFGARRAPDDLVVASVTGPTTAEPGGGVTVSWIVHNVGSGAITANSQDAVYLSTDATLDANDILLTTVPRTGILSAGSAYTETTTVVVPAVLPGSYFFLVSVDRRYQVPNETNRANNILAAELPTVLSLPALVLGRPAAGQFSAAGQDRYFQLAVPEGQTLALTLDSAATAGATELYVSRLHLPTVADHDFASLAEQPDQTLTVPTTQPGTYYILVRSRTGAAAAAGFTLTAAAANLGIQSISPNSGGNTGRVTIELHGTRLTANTQVSLLGGTTTINAAAIDFRDATLLYATFDLTGRATGAYDVRAVDGASTVTLAGAFTVVNGSTDPNPVRITLVTPNGIRRGRQSSVLVEYVNTSNTDVPAPLLELTATNAVLRLEDQRDFSGDFTSGSRIQFLSIAPDGPAGVLRAGQRGRVRVFLQASGGEEGIDINFEVKALASTTAIIDWAALKGNLRPATIPADAWDAIYANFTASVGTTTGQLQDLLDKDASYLSELGVRTTDVGRLMAFEFQQANDFLPGPITTSAVDDSLAAPGLGLTFSRAHLQPVSGRYRLGALGRGWTSNWEMSVSTDGQGNVTLEQSGGLRFFAKQSDGTYLGAPGNFSTLTLSAGVYRLREKDGTVFVFRPDGKLDYVADPHDNRITAGYNAGGQLTSLIHSSGPSLTLAYNTAGRLSQVTDSAGRVTTYTYDGSNEHLLSVTTVEGTTQYSYLTGQGAAKEHTLASITDVDGTHVFFDYDGRGQLTGQRRDGNAEPITLAYDNAGGVTFTDALGAATTVLFNDAGQPELVRDPLGRVDQSDYDANFNLVQLVTPSSSAFSYSYDASGNLTRSVDPLGQENDFTYDPLFNQLTSLRDARGNTTRYAYGAQADLLSIIYPNGSLERFSYDPLGNLTESINRRDHVIDYATNGHGLVTRKTFADGSHVDFTYDGRDNLLTATDSHGTISLEYDSADRLTRIDYPNSRFLQFSYDAGSRRIRSVDQDGFTVNYQYDSVGRLAGLTDGSNAPIVTYTYDAVGRLSRKDLGNHTFTTYEYDAAGQLLHLVNHAPNGSVNSRFDYAYDPLGLRTSMTTLDGQWTYEYDATGRLTHAVFASTNPSVVPNEDLRYAYDAAGNRTQTIINGMTAAYVTNNLNQYTSAGNVSYAYDADGNLLSQTDGTNVTSYTWDDQNQLLGVSGPGGTSNYGYDPFGNRIATTQDGQLTTYLFDPAGFGDVVGEYDSTDNVIAHYTHGLGLVSRIGMSGPAFYDFDAIGSTVGITGATGGYVNKYSYLPFGETMIAGSLANPFTFVGEFGVSREAGGLFRMGARAYDIVTGRFISDDPLGLSGGDTNLRRYVANDPVSLIDPLGETAYSTVYTFVGEGSKQQRTRPAYLDDGEWNPAPVSPAEMRAIGQRGRNNFYNQVSREVSKRFTNGVPTRGFFNRVISRNALKSALARGAAIRGAVGLAAKGGGALAAAGIAISIPEAVGRANDLGKGFRPAQDFGNKAGEAAEPYLRDLCEISPLLCQQLAKILKAFDPNDIVGPSGFGTQQFITPNPSLPYTIHFENQALATAPAQEVFVTHTLDSDVDLSTFALGDFGLGSTTVHVPDGLQSYQTSIDAKNPDGSPLRVNVTAGLNAQTGIVTWTFRSVDPATGQLPAAALAGFLPPNDATGRGEGFVTYTVRTKSGLPSGTAIDAQASIVFDTNAPLATNIFTNTIDAGAPTSSVTPLPALVNSESFNLSWTGEDDIGGSGIASYDIYVSTDGGAYALWMDDAAETSAIYSGQFGHTYRFYSVATDNVGFQELAPSSADATTQVALNDPPIIASLVVAPDPVAQSQSLTLTANGVNDPDGSVSRVEFFRDANLDGIGQPGEKLGEDVNGADGFSLTTAVTWAVGAHTYLARAIDNEGATGAFVGKVATVTLSLAEIAVLGNGVSIADGDSTPATADGSDFGDIVQGQTGPTRTFTVRNDGSSPLTLGSVSLPTGFTLVEALSSSLAPGTSDAFTLQLDGTTPGTKSGEISFATNDSDENPFNFSIAGSVLPGIGVAIGDGAARALTYTEQDGTVVTVTLKGGTATVWLQGENLLPTAGKKGVTVTGSVVEIAEIALDNNTTAKSSLTFTTKGGEDVGVAMVGEISGNTPVGKLTGKGIDLGGIAMTGKGSVAAIDVHAILEGADLIMPGAGNLGGTALKAVRIGAGAEIELGSGLKSLTAGEWSDGSLTAPWAAKITIAGDFGADLLLNGVGNPRQALGSLTVKGNARGNGPNALWKIDGAVGTVNVAGWLEEIDLRVAGPVTSVTAGGVRKSRIFAGVKEDVQDLPDSLDKFVGEVPAEIKSLTIKGIPGVPEPSFEDSMIAAPSLGKVTIKEVEAVKGGTPFGIAADRIKSYARTGFRAPSNLDAPPREVDRVDNYVVRLL